MYRDSQGFSYQDYAGESVPCAHANAMEVQRRLKFESVIKFGQWPKVIDEKTVITERSVITSDQPAFHVE